MPIVWLGNDASGNNNYWSVINFSVTPGSGNDSLVDVPTDWGGDSADAGGEVRGNYAVLDISDKNSAVTLTNGGLNYSASAGSGARTTIGTGTSGLWYFEHTVNSSIGLYTPIIVGASTKTAAVTAIASEPLYLFFYTDSSAWQVRRSVYGSTTDINVSGTSYPVLGDVLQIAYDATNGRAWLGKNNNWINSSGGITGNPSTGENPTFTFEPGLALFPRICDVGAPYSGILNTGQRPFAYTPPTGFKSINTKNINEQYPFANGPDLVWIKNRTSSYNHILSDTVNGPIGYLSSSTTDGFQTAGTAVTEFTSNGFTVGSIAGGNRSSDTHVAWSWNAGSTTSSNKDGVLQSTVRVNKDAGFSIVSYAGSGSDTTVGHGLGKTPDFIIWKALNDAYNWDIYHKSSGYQASLIFTTAGTRNVLHTAPTTNIIPVKHTYTGGSASGQRMVAYCWTEVPGYSKFGAYYGNGVADGSFIHTGFRPRWILIRSTTAARDWLLYDTERLSFNVIGTGVGEGPIQPNTSGLAYNQDGYINACDILSNGFKIRKSTTNINASGEYHLYAAFADMPFKYSVAR